MGTHLREFSESYPMNTNMTGLNDILKSLHIFALNEHSSSIGRANITMYVPQPVLYQLKMI